MPQEERVLFDLLWYQELKLVEAAELLGLTERQVRYRWQKVRLKLVRELDCRLPV